MAEDKSLAEQQGRNKLDPVATPDPALEAAKPDWMKTAKDHDPAIRASKLMNKSNLSPREVREWASNTVAEVLNFSFNDMEERFNTFPGYFTQQGYQQYMEYIDKAKLRDILRKFSYTVNGVVINQPYIAAEDDVGGYYRWLIEVPVMLSYMKGGSAQISKDNAPLTDNILVTIEISRVPEGGGEFGIAIHTWIVKTRKL